MRHRLLGSWIGGHTSLVGRSYTIVCMKSGAAYIVKGAIYYPILDTLEVWRITNRLSRFFFQMRRR